ncbi:MAG: HhH-GPD-type base excision DNA repair protein [Jatrophihabitans sp.]
MAVRNAHSLWWDRCMFLATTEQANALLDQDPLALLVGMLLDQQIPMEKAFTSPEVLRERLGGSLDAHTIAGYDEESFEAIFRAVPALHRFPAAMAKRVQALARVLVERYDGRADAVWDGVPSGTQLVERIAALPGFGQQKAKIFTALLGKQVGVRPDGWREAAGDYGLDGALRSVADVVDAATLKAVRAHKQEMKAAAKAAAAR